MDETKFAKSLITFKRSMETERKKRKRTILIREPSIPEKITVLSVETNLPKLHIHDLISPQGPREDPLAKLVRELGIDKEEAALISPLQEVLSSIKPIEPGRRARFQINCQHGSVEIHIRRSLDVWIIVEGTKLVFPKPRNDRDSGTQLFEKTPNQGEM